MSLTTTKIERVVLFALAAVLCAAAGCRKPQQAQPQRLPTVEIRAGDRVIPVELAATPEQRNMGMMHRERLGPDEGMLFVFPRDRILSFYMKNTLAPLSIAFLRAHGTILNIEDMAPQTLASHRSRLPCRLALEMPQGWFERNGLKEGDRIALPPDLHAQN